MSSCGFLERSNSVICFSLLLDCLGLTANLRNKNREKEIYLYNLKLRTQSFFLKIRFVKKLLIRNHQLIVAQFGKKSLIVCQYSG